MLTDAIKLNVAHYLFSSAYADEKQNAGGGFSAGEDICEAAPRQPDEAMLPIINDYLGELGEAWGIPADVMMFDVLELGPEDAERALCHTLMGCWGHGLSLGDDYGDAVKEGERKLDREIDETPFHSDFFDLTYMAERVVQDELDAPDEDSGLDQCDDYSRGDRVEVWSRMPPGDILRGQGTIHGLLSPPEDDRWVIRMDQEVEPHGYGGMLVVVEGRDWEPL